MTNKSVKVTLKKSLNGRLKNHKACVAGLGTKDSSEPSARGHPGSTRNDQQGRVHGRRRRGVERRSEDATEYDFRAEGSRRARKRVGRGIGSDSEDGRTRPQRSKITLRAEFFLGLKAGSSHYSAGYLSLGSPRKLDAQLGKSRLPKSRRPTQM